MATFPVRFPNVKSSFSTIVRPMFSSIVQKAVSGREVRIAQQLTPIWQFELTFDVLRDMTQNEEPWWNNQPYHEFQEVSTLFLVCRGQFGNFLWANPTDNSRARGFINFGDASTQSFVVPRYWSQGDLTVAEPVGAVDRIDNLYLNGLVQPELSYQISGNQITITPPPGVGVPITADFKFSYLCRFTEDMQEYEQFMFSLWKLGKCKFQSIKQPDLPTT